MVEPEKTLLSKINSSKGSEAVQEVTNEVTQPVPLEEPCWSANEQQLIAEQISKLLEKGFIRKCQDSPATLDLKDAYYLVSIDIQYRKYLRFRFNGELYDFTCLPFGLSTALYVFAKILKPLFAILRSQGYISVRYLDDAWLMSKSNTGFRMRIELPDSKKDTVSHLVKNYKNLRVCKIREFASLIGTLNSCCPAMRYGWVYLKNLEREKTRALEQNGGNYEARMKAGGVILMGKVLWIFVSYIQSKENKIADQESKRLEPRTEYELNEGAFRKICNKFGSPEIDLFASRIYSKCRRYISWRKDPRAMTAVTFTVKWNSWFFYAFPPFTLIPKILS
ncbi:hypothetical protein M0804_002979 [Polistes exclamans]|nr:hypothetical protein M0804_002979 [Polistes exclamans]